MKLEILTPSKSPERVREYNKRYRELFPEMVKQSCKNWAIKNKEYDRTRKRNYFLERKELRRRGTNMYRWLKLNGFPEGYQILCANCNAFKRFHPEWKGM